MRAEWGEGARVCERARLRAHPGRTQGAPQPPPVLANPAPRKHASQPPRTPASAPTPQPAYAAMGGVDSKGDGVAPASMLTEAADEDIVFA